MDRCEHEDEKYGSYSTAAKMAVSLPPGFRFLPTDEELVTHYLMNKVFNFRPIPPRILCEIDARNLYSRPPKTLEEFSGGQKEIFFFIHEDRKFEEGKNNKRRRMVGDGSGFWQRSGDRVPIYDSHGNALAFKIHLIFFSVNSLRPKKTHWRMDEYHLCLADDIDDDHQNSKGVKWVIGRMKRGTEYKSHLY